MDAVDRERDVSAQADRSEATSRLIIEIAAAASGELDLDHILQTALARLRSVVRLTGGSIALVEGEELVVRAAVGPFADEALGQRLARGPSRSWGVIESRRPFLTGDLRTSGDRIRGARDPRGARIASDRAGRSRRSPPARRRRSRRTPPSR